MSLNDFLEIGSVQAEMVGHWEVGGCTWRVQTAWLLLGLAIERPWLALGGPTLSEWRPHKARSQFSMPIHAKERNAALFLVCLGSHWPRAMNINNLLMSECGLSHKSAEDGCKGRWVKFRASKPKGREYGTFKGPIILKWTLENLNQWLISEHVILNSPYQVQETMLANTITSW